MSKVLGLAIIIGGPLLLWLDVWLAFQFGFWLNDISGDASGSAGGVLGIMAFFVLASAQVWGVLMIGDEW